MGGFIKWLIGWPWCWHKWDLFKVVSVFEDGAQYPYKRKYILRCAQCGDFKRRTM